MRSKKGDSRKTVTINLSEKKITINNINGISKFKGGRNLTSQLILREINPDVHYLSKHNNFYIATGLLSGTLCPNSGRCSFGAKSPLTGGIKEANVGGTLATYLGKMEVAFIKIVGKSDKENVIFIQESASDNNPDVKLFSVESISGADTYKTTDILQSEFGSDTSIVTIGPAGEKKYLSACICVTDIDGKPTRQAARGGLGTILGSKGIKAIVVKKPKKNLVNYMDKEKFIANARELTDILKKSESTAEALPYYGTIANMEAINEFGGLPTRNFSAGSFEGADKIGCEEMRKRIVERNAKPTHACMPGCIIKCSNTYNDKNGIEITGGFEYECIWALGANCGIDDLDYIAYMNRVCDELGIDCVEIGNTIAVIMESGYISFGDKEGAAKLLNEVRKDSPLGKIVASGCEIAGKIFGVERVPQVKGQGMAAYDPRAFKAMGATYTTSPMGADHTASFSSAYELYEIGKTVDPLDPKGKVDVSKELQQIVAFLDSTGLCVFVMFAALEDKRGLLPVLEMINARYGLNLNEKSVFDIGSKIIEIEKEFNLKCGLGEETNKIPEFFRQEKLDTHSSVFDVEKDELIRF